MPIASEVRRPQVLPPNAAKWMWDSSLALYVPLWHPLTNKSPFTSMDKNALSCTVVGATWGSTGRLYTGSDDYITVGAGANFNYTSEAFSFGAWINVSDLAANRFIFEKGGTNAYGYRFWIGTNGGISFQTFQVGAVQTSNTATDTIVINTWCFIAAVRNGASVRIYRNGIDVTDTVGTHINPADSSAQALLLGRTGAATLNGIYGEVFMYGSKALTAAEVMNIHLATKWRYQ